MENNTLLALMEEDKSTIMAALSQNRTPDAAQVTLEKALDRVLLRYGEPLTDDGSQQAAQLVIRTLRSALPLMDSIGEVRRWNREAGSAKPKKMKPLAIGLLCAAGVLELATLMGLTLAGGRVNAPVIFIEALIPGALAVGAAYWSGLTAGRPEKPAGDTAILREEFLIDPEKVWRNLRGMLLIADDALIRLRAEAEVRRTAEALPESLDRRESELFSTLLESAYAMDTADAREMVEAMRFYLHGAGIEAQDYAPGRESWFEFLPADRPGTLRPALLSGDRIVKKGLASR